MPESREDRDESVQVARELKSKLRNDGWNAAWTYLACHPFVTSRVARSASKWAPKTGPADIDDAKAQAWLKFGEDLCFKSSDLLDRDDESLAMWFLGIAKFEAIALHRDRGARSLRVDNPEYPATNVEREQQRLKRRRISLAFQRAAEDLPDHLTALFHMWFAGASNAQMKKALGVSDSRLRKLIDQLKKHLSAHIDLAEINSQM